MNEGDFYSISRYMLDVLESYRNLCNETNIIKEFLFWDAVIISASDMQQEVAYKLQIHEKQIKRTVPQTVPFHVFADPPGYKIGCGGSTMYILERLQDRYGSALHGMRFLLIPAGGYSQRLPNTTVLGKLFMPLPLGGGGPHQMIDLVLACYLPFLKRAPPGVFVAASDAIIGFDLSDDDPWTFHNDGFTALAHPSPVDVGLTHGVYVLPPTDNETTSFVSDCLRVLQKPSLEEMKEKGAIVHRASGDIVFSDSAFFFDHAVTNRLIQFYSSHQPIQCELSSYGDFLRPLGQSASPSYIAEQITSRELATTRSALYDHLHGTPLRVLVLARSTFHHLGSMGEYLDSLCFANTFGRVFPVSSPSCSAFSVPAIAPAFVEGCVVQSVVHPLSVLPRTSVLECCDLSVALDVGERCVVSNVRVEGGVSVHRLPLPVPDNSLVHTVSLATGGGYVTVAFGVDDDVKRRHEFPSDVVFFGESLGSDAARGLSLWEARLFPVCADPRESLVSALRLLLRLGDEAEGDKVSMQDVMTRKDAEKMVGYQKQLRDKIALMS